MGCCELVHGDTVIHVCRPTGQWEVARKRRRRFWCFGCRKHLMHTLMVFRQTEPSYYADFVKWECPQCHEENVLFPGHEWDYGD